MRLISKLYSLQRFVSWQISWLIRFKSCASLISSSSYEWQLGTKLSSYGCTAKDKFSIVTHGWRDSNSWVPLLVENLLKHRGGCVIFLNYSSCIDEKNYVVTMNKWRSVSAVVTKKLKDMKRERIPPANVFLYGFSLGARIIVEAAINLGSRKLGWLTVGPIHLLNNLINFNFLPQCVNLQMRGSMEYIIRTSKTPPRMFSASSPQIMPEVLFEISAIKTG